jgi:hypothetical protein
MVRESGSAERREETMAREKRRTAVAAIRLGCRASIIALLLGFAASCGGGPTKPTQVATFDGVFPELGSVNYFAFDAFPGAQGDVRFSLNWSVPAQGTSPVAGMTLWNIGIPDRVVAASPRTATPPVALTGEGNYLAVSCDNCRGRAPVPFTLTVEY